MPSVTITLTATNRAATGKARMANVRNQGDRPLKYGATIVRPGRPVTLQVAQLSKYAAEVCQDICGGRVSARFKNRALTAQEARKLIMAEAPAAEVLGEATSSEAAPDTGEATSTETETESSESSSTEEDTKEPVSEDPASTPEEPQTDPEETPEDEPEEVEETQTEGEPTSVSPAKAKKGKKGKG